MFKVGDRVINIAPLYYGQHSGPDKPGKTYTVLQVEKDAFDDDTIITIEVGQGDVQKFYARDCFVLEKTKIKNNCGSFSRSTYV